MSFSHGSVAKLTVNSVDVSDYLSDATYNDSIDAAETTTLGKTAKTYIPGLDDGTFKCSGYFDPTMDAAIFAMKRLVVPFTYSPQGIGTGLVQYTGNCVLSSYSVGTAVKDAGSGDAEWQITGDVTRTIQS